LNNNFTEIVGVSSPREESLVADCTFILDIAPESVFLYIADALHHEPNREKYYPSDISTRPKRMLMVLQNLGRVENRYR